MLSQEAKRNTIEALELLNKAALDEKDEIASLVKEKFENLRAVFDANKQFMNSRLAQGQEKLREVALDVDDRLKTNPWPYMFGTAAVAFTLGALIEAKHCKTNGSGL